MKQKNPKIKNSSRFSSFILIKVYLGFCFGWESDSYPWKTQAISTAKRSCFQLRLACKTTDEQQMTRRCGSAGFVAPEVRQGFFCSFPKDLIDQRNLKWSEMRWNFHWEIPNSEKKKQNWKARESKPLSHQEVDRTRDVLRIFESNFWQVCLGTPYESWLHIYWDPYRNWYGNSPSQPSTNRKYVKIRFGF